MSVTDHFARLVLAGVLNSLWTAVALAAVSWLMVRVIPRTNAATRHLLWWAVLALVVVLPFVPAKRSQNRPIVSAPGPVFETAAVPAPLPDYVPTQRVRRAGFPLQLPEGKWLRAAIVLWIFAGLLQLCRIAWSFHYLRAVKRNSGPASLEIRRAFDLWVEACAIRRPVRVLVSSRVASPLVIGFRCPAVILPETLLPELEGRELDHVLLHELAHIARRDDWSNLAARVLAAIVGLHPVSSWVLRQVARERELACDEWVVSMTGEARPYAASLARLFELCGTRHRTVLAAGMAGPASHLGQRIETLLHRRERFTRRASLIRVAVALSALMAFVAMGARFPRWVVLAQSAQAPTPANPAKVNPRGSFLAALVAAGYGDLTVDQIISLKEHGVTANFLAGISQSGWGRMTAEELTDLVTHGVSPEYLHQVHVAGFQHPSIRDVIALHEHGVRPEAMAEIHGYGFGPYSPSQAIDFAGHSVAPELFRAARDAGITRLDAADAIDAVNRGVRASTFRAAEQYGSHLTLQQIVRLKQAGVIQ